MGIRDTKGNIITDGEIEMNIPESERAKIRILKILGCSVLGFFTSLGVVTAVNYVKGITWNSAYVIFAVSWIGTTACGVFYFYQSNKNNNIKKAIEKIQKKREKEKGKEEEEDKEDKK